MEEEWELMKAEFGLTPPYRKPYQFFKQQGDLEGTLDMYFGMRRHQQREGQDVSFYDKALPSEMAIFRAQQERKQEEAALMPEKYKFNFGKATNQEKAEFHRRMEEPTRKYISKEEEIIQANKELVRMYPAEAKNFSMGGLGGLPALKSAERRVETDRKLKEHREKVFQVEQERLREMERQKQNLEAEALKKAEEEIELLKQQQKLAAMVIKLEDKSHIYQLVEGGLPPDNQEEEVAQGTAPKPTPGSIMGTGRSIHLISGIRSFTPAEVYAIREEYWTATGNKESIRGQKIPPPHSIADITNRLGARMEKKDKRSLYSKINSLINRVSYHDDPLAPGEPQENLALPSASQRKLKREAQKKGITLEIGSGGLLAIPEEIRAAQKIKTSERIRKSRMEFEMKLKENPEEYKRRMDEMNEKRIETRRKTEEKKKENKAKAKAEVGAGERSNAAAGGGY
jgi:hypothetical protein